MGIYGTRDGIFTVKKLAIQDKIPISYNIPLTATVATGAIAGGLDVNAGTAAKKLADFSGQPPYALNIGVTANSGAGVRTDRLRVTGFDNLGVLRYEDVQIGSGAGSTFFTNYSYSEITELQPYTSAGALGTSGSSDIGVGYGNQAGLPGPIASSGDLLAFTVGSTNATTAPTIDVTYNQVTIAGTDSARKAVHVLYLSRLQERTQST